MPALGSRESLTCKGCECQFERPQLRGRCPSFCSPRCRRVTWNLASTRRPCPVCSGPVPPPPETGGRPREYCSEPCRLVYVYARRRATLAGTRADRRVATCRTCDLRFLPEGRGRSVFCSAPCKARWREQTRQAALTTARPCERCGADVARRGKRGPIPRLCEECATPRSGSCRVCGALTVRPLTRSSPGPADGRRRALRSEPPETCSSACKKHLHRLRSGVEDVERPCPCGVKFRTTARSIRRYCSADCARDAKAERERTNPRVFVWTEQRKTAAEVRRALKTTTQVEPIAVREIAVRDGWRCGLCRRRVNPALAWPHPRSLSLDHVIPLSLGGGHVRENVQAAHLRCNLRKGARAAGEQLALFG